MRTRAVAVVAVIAAGLGCPSRRPPPKSPAVTPDTRARIAGFEAARGDGVEGVLAIANGGSPAERDLALRALGRIGGPRAVGALIAATGDRDPAIATRAATAIGVLAATSDPGATEVAKLSKVLVATLDRPGIDRAAVLEAIGRAGDASALGELADAVVARDLVAAEAAAIALGRFGRREIALDDLARNVLVGALGPSDTALRRAAAWSLGREFRAPDAAEDPVVTTALVKAVSDSDAEVRALAIVGLVRRKVAAGASRAIEIALRDTDWRVAVEAVRALAGDTGTDAGRDAVAAIAVREWARLETGDATPGTQHVVIEALRALSAHATRPIVRDALVAIQSRAAMRVPEVPALVGGWVLCLATGALERAAPDRFDGGQRILSCSEGLPAHHRAEILVDAIEAGLGTPTQRRDVVLTLIGSSDVGSRATALDGLPALWEALSVADREAIVPAIARAMAASAAIEAGTAAEVAGKLLSNDKDPSDRVALVTALIERANRETDAEMMQTLLGAIASSKIETARPVCERATTAASPVTRAAARDCLAAYAKTSPDAPKPDLPLDEPAAGTPPPEVDPSTVIGRRVTWRIATRAGEVAIALEPDVAPWHVATIAALTRKGFYDGLVFHRVVPDFVIQGGDPTGTGWGGPGFTTPAEPGSRLDGDSYTAGAVGIADAGKDSGGSQWFVMHSRAPHLEGRYTRIGRVTDGQGAIDALVVGDKIDKATIAIE
jgi:cyclophilin family peptidyl-prolyl cis-trans isomerase